MTNRTILVHCDDLVIGGVSRTLLASMTVAVLMSH